MAMTPVQWGKTVSQQFYQPPFREGAREQVWPWEQAYTIKNSTAALEQTYGYAGMGIAQASGVYGDVYYQDMEEMGTVTWTHGTYTLGAQLPQQLIEDSKYVDFTQEIGIGTGRGHAAVRDLAAVLPFDRAFDSDYPMYDGTEMCGTHTTKSDDTIANEFTTDLTLNYANIFDVNMYFQNSLLDQKGIPITDNGEMLLYHTNKTKGVRLALENEWEPDTGNRNMSLLKKYNLRPLPCRVLDNENSWFILGSKFKAGNWWFNRVMPTVDSENEFDRYGMKFRSRQRFSNGPRSGLYIAGVPGS